MSTKAMSIPWGRIAIEAVAIVASILFAFALDAWWDAQSDRVEEGEVLTRLFDEFTENSERLAQTQASQRRLLASAEVLFEVTGPTGGPNIPDDSLAALFNGAVTRASFTPLTGELNSLLQSGSLHLIQSTELRAALAAWPDLVRALNQEEQRAFADVDAHFIPYMSHRVSWRSIDFLAGTEGYDRPSGFEGGLRSVLRDRLFENLLGNHHVYAQRVLRRSATVEAGIDRIVRLITSQIGPQQ